LRRGLDRQIDHDAAGTQLRSRIDDRRRHDRQDLRWLAVALAVDALLVVADDRVGPLAGTFVLTPFFLALVAAPRTVVLGSIASVGLAAASGLWNDNLGSGPYWIRLAIVVLGAGLAYYAARDRRRSEAAALTLEAQAAVGEVVEVTPTAVIGIDASGTVTLFNPAAETMFGIRSEEALGRELAALVVPARLRDAHRAGLARVRSTGESRLLGRRIDMPALRADGGEFPAALTITRLPGAGGPAFAGFVRDVTDEKRAELAHRLRARTTELLEKGADHQGTLLQVAKLPVPELADWCWIVMPSAGDRIVVAADSTMRPRPLRQSPPSSAERAPAVRRVIDTGACALEAEATGEILSAYAQDRAHLDRMRELGVRSLMAVPLKAGRRVLGAMVLTSTDAARRYSRADLELAGETGQRAGAAIENARLYEERASTAATLMASLRPPTIPDLPGWRTATLYEPAGRTDEVGGDFYDVFATGRGWMLVIGDVVGHGPSAAALTSLARYSIRAAGTLTGSPRPALQHLNDQLRQDGRLALLSAVGVLLNDGPDGVATARIAVAGHPRPVLIRDGEPRLVGTTSLVLGVVDDADYVEDRIEIEPGDCLVLYTDGVLDAAGETERFGEDRLLEAVGGDAATPDTRLERVRRALADFQIGPQRDDIAVLAVQRTAQRSPDDAALEELRVPM
jgi:PAS domain S-box-containing protein